MHAVPVCTLQGKWRLGQEEEKKPFHASIFSLTEPYGAAPSRPKHTAVDTKRAGFAAKRLRKKHQVKEELLSPYGTERIVHEWRKEGEAPSPSPQDDGELVNIHLSREGSLHTDVTHKQPCVSPLSVTRMTFLLRAGTCSSGKWKNCCCCFF